MDAMASQLQTYLGGTASPAVENLQVDGRLMFNPTPPAIDIYPADPFQAELAMGPGNRELFFLVRARVAGDHEAQQDLLLSLMDPSGSTSLAAALESNVTLGGVVDNLVVGGPSGFGVFPEPLPNTGTLLGCTWTVEVWP